MKNREIKNKNRQPVTEAQAAAKKRALYSGGRSVGITALAVALAVGINLLVNLLPSGYRLIETANSDAFYPSSATQSYLEALPEDGGEIVIYIVSSSGSEDTQLELFASRVAELSDRVRLDRIDPDINPERVAGLTGDTVANNSLIVACGDRAKTVQNTDIFTYNYDVDSNGSYYVSSISFNGDDLTLSAIKYVLADELPKVYILQGHGEVTLPETLLTELTHENIDYEYLSLLTAGGVPEDADCVIAADPTEDINEDEYQMLLDYLESGGDMLVTTEYNPAGGYPQRFMSLLEYYGFAAGDVVFEGNSQYYYQQDYYLLPDFAEHDITASLAGSSSLVLMPLAHAIYETDLHRDTIEISPLLLTSSSAWTGTISSSGELPLASEATDSGSFMIGALAEESYGEVTTRVAWYSTDGILDSSTDTLVAGHNTSLLLSTLGYLCDFTSAIGEHSATIEINHLILSGSSGTGLTIVICAALPAALVIAGLAVYFKRRTK